MCSANAVWFIYSQILTMPFDYTRLFQQKLEDKKFHAKTFPLNDRILVPIDYIPNINDTNSFWSALAQLQYEDIVNDLQKQLHGEQQLRNFVLTLIQPWQMPIEIQSKINDCKLLKTSEEESKCEINLLKQSNELKQLEMQLREQFCKF